MSIVGNNRVGIPIVLLHDAEGAVVTVETKRGELIRGLLFEAEDMMNLYLKKAVVLGPKPGSKRIVEQIYVRGTEIVFIVLPEMLRHAPMFNRIKHWRKYGGAPPEGVGAAGPAHRREPSCLHVDWLPGRPRPRLWPSEPPDGGGEVSRS